VSAARWYATGTRWMKFNLVGAAGIGVQLGALALLTRGLDMNYLWATALAVEFTVLHNFAWHERFTWSDRSSGQLRDAWLRLWRFSLSVGITSIGGNLLFMFCLAGLARLPALPANLTSIAACSLLNFLVADRWVFRLSPPPP